MVLLRSFKTRDSIKQCLIQVILSQFSSDLSLRVDTTFYITKLRCKEESLISESCLFRKWGLGLCSLILLSLHHFSVYLPRPSCCDLSLIQYQRSTLYSSCQSWSPELGGLLVGVNLYLVFIQMKPSFLTRSVCLVILSTSMNSLMLCSNGLSPVVLSEFRSLKDIVDFGVR